MKILVTGAAGFIGSALSLRLLDRGDTVIGIDNHNDYYDPKIKEARLARHIDHSNYKHCRIDISNQKDLEKVFFDNKLNCVVNLAAQAGVRYSIENPFAYIQSNIVGFANILEGCRHHKVDHLVYASTSSVYGSNTNMPFSEHDNTNHPLSLYAATKKSNEMMAHAYSHLYQLPTTGLRFFTVYGPWGRPDMAPFKFTRSILEEKQIDVFNYGKHTRDFTYIDDIVEGLIKVIDKPASSNDKWDSNHPDTASSKAPWCIYNIGNNQPIQLLDYIKSLEKVLAKKANINFLPLQPGDIKDTDADISDLMKIFHYKPNTTIDEGNLKFINWYKQYFNL
jgi:UDP-glucuronate 4-epimerase